MTLIFFKIRWRAMEGDVQTEKLGKTGGGVRCLTFQPNFGLKLNVHVQYNMLRLIWYT